MKRRYSIALCSSMVFYKQLISVKRELTSLGFQVLVPNGARVMEKDQDFDVKRFVSKYYGKNFAQEKRKAVKAHFEKINQTDAILVCNYTKHGVEGYIGPNVLMEMGLAFYLNKKIFVLNPIPKDSPFVDELSALVPTVLDGNLTQLHKIV